MEVQSLFTAIVSHIKGINNTFDIENKDLHSNRIDIFGILQLLAEKNKNAVLLSRWNNMDLYTHLKLYKLEAEKCQKNPNTDPWVIDTIKK